ncbi:hypothetical protein CAEBREN_05689 [Caenorhabditis brenneri]|uniref:SPK domain-containing protein n=1 Tax=Caenorhabditis brenneri TaxID=135651 RepID=G0P721_CAEBE|nr:hypothetical protein CAEBREN_05689 [Caenorhabditis brenneri]
MEMLWTFLYEKVKVLNEPVEEKDEIRLITSFLKNHILEKRWSPIQLLKHFQEEMKKCLHLQNDLDGKLIFMLYKRMQIYMSEDIAKRLEMKLDVLIVKRGGKMMMAFDKDEAQRPIQSQSTPKSQLATPSDDSSIDDSEPSFTDCRCGFHRNEKKKKVTCCHCKSLAEKNRTNKKGARFSTNEQTAMSRHVFERSEFVTDSKDLEAAGSEFWSDFRLTGYDGAACAREEKVLSTHFQEEMKTCLHLQNDLDGKLIFMLYKRMQIIMSDDIAKRLEVKFDVLIVESGGQMMMALDKDEAQRPIQSQSTSISQLAAPSDDSSIDEPSFTDCRCGFHQNEKKKKMICCHCKSLAEKNRTNKKGARFSVSEKTAMSRYVFERLEFVNQYKDLQAAGSEFWADFRLTGYDGVACAREDKLTGELNTNIKQEFPLQITAGPGNLSENKKSGSVIWIVE